MEVFPLDNLGSTAPFDLFDGRELNRQFYLSSQILFSAVVFPIDNPNMQQGFIIN
jgi:hypothetical protein